MTKPEEDDRIVMVGASFDEIAAEALAVVEREIDKQLQAITPNITRAS